MIGISVANVKSSNDNRLNWPFNGSFVIAICHPELNGENNTKQKTFNAVESASQRPTTATNTFQGITDCCSLQEIRGRYLYNDSTIVMCQVI